MELSTAIILIVLAIVITIGACILLKKMDTLIEILDEIEKEEKQKEEYLAILDMIIEESEEY